MEQLLTVEEASRQLHVSPRRVRAMVTSGSLPAEKRGRQWMVPTTAVRELHHNRMPSHRPLTAISAWARIGELADGEGRRRARDASLHELRRLVRARAVHRSLYVHPGVLSNLRDRPDVVLGGRDAAVAVQVPADPTDVDLYVRASDADSILRSVAARDASDGANVRAHVVADDAWPFEPDQRFANPWVAWLDLEDRQDRAADALLDRLLGGRARA